ncbi:NADP-dependent D-sorbitol-6-phosphate dehydrogenase-like isoform X3 [Populus nigra]|uniref:NADP-dependent D-sorbitol-6-phosphate dehydrogenase-like isoform X3 n=1 Tax=Populus nigra TaxID=3691 RepID=UPI002B274324|nr:NADP-dependent D-sorbitol-6-phosphate dehydrogenase-like isoform X3 [Populus nigra]
MASGFCLLFCPCDYTRLSFVVEQMAITLNNGFQMLIIGLGVRRMEGKEIKNLVINPIKLGYRHFDCVADHKSEAIIGEVLAEAFKTGLAKREDLFITSKVLSKQGLLRGRIFSLLPSSHKACLRAA